MSKLFNTLRHRRDLVLLGMALLLLIIAIFKPTWPIKRDIYSYIFVVDISQSMNAIDEKLDGKPVSRMQYQQHLMHRVISELPCGTQVSIGLFAGVSVAALYTPIEVCSNFHILEDSIDHLDWRMSWSGNSRVRESLFTLARLIRSFPEPAQVVYFTDGEEAPKLHAFNTKDLTGFQGAKDWLFVGIGSDEGTAIPKLDDKNQLIGYWSAESFAMQPGIAQISEANIGIRDDNVAGSASDRYISKLDEKYLESIAKEIDGNYVNGSSLQNVLFAMQKQPPARRNIADFDLRWILAGLAGLLFLLAYIPKQPIQYLKTLWSQRTQRNQSTKASKASSSA
ncbi:MAG: vWA domain-containing protein [Methylophilus sp.]|jgi:mxaL protein